MAEDKNLREAGLKVTLPRIRILEIFEESDDRHLSADEVYKKLVEAGDEVGLATVYRVLTQFESAGILLKQNFENGHSVYELTPNDHHDHMVCLKTGKVIEFTNEIIEEQQEKLAAESGYKIVDHKLVLYVEPISNND
ncbi:MAG: ferric iron uptake transcriptional regulator [Pseudomonadota bacterium]|jgi:Fur family ferric uptake transcriptional regulator|nr:ferric iron uptake transcriptional regulator [Pseudomonadota bacterium]MEC7787809.1 ferric iron uptake transcriptional regulator [Pseudomonadota bacterium]MEC8378081.1 ferric iron uptake transcriptional regulator [Pseudomonadota bacterium]|tara:strand:- start:586 stop:999 length:414 start_codon:yes stop_codon:yes gene_type:complete